MRVTLSSMCLCIIALAGSMAACGDDLREPPLTLLVDAADLGAESARQPVAEVPEESAGPPLDPFADEPIDEVASTCTDSSSCDPLNRLWVRVDYLHWWLQGYAVPPLVATGVDPNQQLTLGNERLDTGGRSGLRLYVGYQLMHCPDLSVEADFFTLEQGGQNRMFVDIPDPIWRPFLDANNNNVLTYEEADTIDVSSSSKLASAGVLLRKNVLCCYDPCERRGYSVDVLGGYRHYRLNEALTVQEVASPLGARGGFDLLDRFETDNHFNGGELGLRAACYRGPWALEGLAKVALGNLHQEVIVSGRTIAPLPPPQTPPGGLLAQPTNIGAFSQDSFAAIPEFELRLRRQLTQHLSFSVGYTFILLSQMVRPGDQIDPVVDARWLNPNNFPPGPLDATRPERRFVRSDPWLQGINLELAWNY